MLLWGLNLTNSKPVTQIWMQMSFLPMIDRILGSVNQEISNSFRSIAKSSLAQGG